MKSTYRVKQLVIFCLEVAMLPFMRFKNGTEFVLETWQDWSLLGVFLLLIFTALSIKCEQCKTSDRSLAFGRSVAKEAKLTMMLAFAFKRRCPICDIERY